MNIREGMKARFCPSCMCGGNDAPSDRAAKSITGIIRYVNWEHRVFTVEYTSGDTIHTEAFHFFDIGKTVTIYG